MLMRATGHTPTGHTPTTHAPPIWTNHYRMKFFTDKACEAPPQRPNADDLHLRQCQFDTRHMQKPQRYHTARPRPTHKADTRNQPSDAIVTDLYSRT